MSEFSESTGRSIVSRTVVLHVLVALTCAMSAVSVWLLWQQRDHADVLESLLKDRTTADTSATQLIRSQGEQIKQLADSLALTGAAQRESLDVARTQSEQVKQLTASLASATTTQGQGMALLRTQGEATELSLARLATLIAEFDTAATKLRAEAAAKAAEVALAEDRRADAIRYMLSAATTDPGHSSYALRLAEIVESDPAKSPEGLAAATAALHALSIHGSGDAVLKVWSAADRLDNARIELEESESLAAAATATADAERERVNDCAMLRELTAKDIRGAVPIERLSMIQDLSVALAAVDVACPASTGAEELLLKWQRVIVWYDALETLKRLLVSAKGEVDAGRAAGPTAAAVIGSAEGSLRTLWQLAGESDVGATAWAESAKAQSQLQLYGEKIAEAIDAPTLAAILADTKSAFAAAKGTRDRLSLAAKVRAHEYTDAIQNLSTAARQLLARSAGLTSRSARTSAEKELRELEGVGAKLLEGRIGSYAAHCSARIAEALERYAAENVVSAADARNFCRIIYPIDVGLLPPACGAAYNSVWGYLESELGVGDKAATLLARMATIKWTLEDF